MVGGNVDRLLDLKADKVAFRFTETVRRDEPVRRRGSKSLMRKE